MPLSALGCKCNSSTPGPSIKLNVVFASQFRRGVNICDVLRKWRKHWLDNILRKITESFQPHIYIYIPSNHLLLKENSHLYHLRPPLNGRLSFASSRNNAWLACYRSSRALAISTRHESQTTNRRDGCIKTSSMQPCKKVLISKQTRFDWTSCYKIMKS